MSVRYPESVTKTARLRAEIYHEASALNQIEDQNSLLSLIKYF